MKEAKEMGKCYRKVGKFAMYKDECGFFGVYSLFEDDGKEYANFRGYLAYPENFESVLADLEYEDRVMMRELEEEFGMKFA
jgi:hypothetical protein